MTTIKNRGYFEIGILNGKSVQNLGTLWRSAYQLGAVGIFTIGGRYHKQASDVLHSYRHVPLRNYETVEDFLKSRPYDCPLIAVEMGGREVSTFTHPERAIYLLGAEDYGVPEAVLGWCQNTISLGSVRTESYNVAVAGSIIMYDRFAKSLK